MTSTTASAVFFPIEVIEYIISLLWLSPLSIPERAFLMKSSLLVSSAWQSIFVKVVATDFHIIGPSHGLMFLDMLRGRMQTPIDYPLDTLCRSITIEHANDHLLPGPETQEQQPAGLLFGALIHELHRSPRRFPHLRRLSLELKDYLMETVFERNATLFSRFPKQVTELELNFTYGEDTDPISVQVIKSRGFEKFGLEKVKSADHGVRKLTVLGTSSGVAKEVLSVFGGLERVDLFKQDAWKEVAEPVVPAIEQEENNDEEFLEAEAGLEPTPKSMRSADESWAGSEETLVQSFSKDDLERMLSALRRQLAVI
ncbi:hypothetical protein V5O48_007335 [Marasmius crinis-equi]|uniref:F-box domain-containing protein n=1 Tax=Marasmius crinis-equi TaxID=585013 RepID=A0ABR3FH23_9AGAR